MMGDSSMHLQLAQSDASDIEFPFDTDHSCHRDPPTSYARRFRFALFASLIAGVLFIATRSFARNGTISFAGIMEFWDMCHYDVGNLEKDMDVVLQVTQCPRSAILELVDQGLVIVKELSEKEAYVGCAGAGDRKQLRKISCDTSKCFGKAWCYADNQCFRSQHGLRVGSNTTPTLNCSVLEPPGRHNRGITWSTRICSKAEVAAPTTREAIIALMKTSAPVAIGEAWSYWLGRRTPGQPILGLRDNWSGKEPTPIPGNIHASEKTFRFKTGTTFGEIKHTLSLTKDRALYDRVQFDQISFGGAVRTAAHGWSTEKSFIETISAFEGVERFTGKPITAVRGSAGFWEKLFDENVVILTADVETRDNDLLCIMQFADRHPPKIEEALPAMERINEGPLFSSPFALLFIDAHGLHYRRGTYYNESNGCWQKGVRHPGGVVTNYFRTLGMVWSDLVGYTFGKAIPEYKEVNTINTGHTLLIMLPFTFAALWGYTILGEINLEAIIDFFPNLSDMVVVLKKFHEETCGRTEVRQRRNGNSEIVWLDLAMCGGHGESGVTKYLQMLHDELGVSTVSFHPGKYVPSSGGPLNVITQEEFWRSAESRV